MTFTVIARVWFGLSSIGCGSSWRNNLNINSRNGAAATATAALAAAATAGEKNKKNDETETRIFHEIFFSILEAQC